MVDGELMPGRTKDIKASLKQFEKNDLVLRETIARRHGRLNARWDALRASDRQNDNPAEVGRLQFTAAQGSGKV